MASRPASLLPDEFHRLPPGLQEIDELLDDPVFSEAFVSHFSPSSGWPSISIETHLRLMHLWYRYRLGFETLCAEVDPTDSGLLVRGVAKLAGRVARLRRQSDEVKAEVLAITGELADLADVTIAKARSVERRGYFVVAAPVSTLVNW